MDFKRVCMPLLLLFSVISCPLFGQTEDWPRWRGANGDGRWQQPPAIAAKWPAKLHEVWRTPIGPGYSGIAVAGPRVFTMDRDKDRNQERVVCCNRQTGRIAWEYRYTANYGKLDYGKGPRSTPTIHQGRVYCLGAVGHLHCLDAASGKRIWVRNLVKDHQAQQPNWGFASSPIVFRDQLIVHAGLKPCGCYAAFDLATGAERWRAGSDPAGYATPVLTKHRGHNLLVGWTPASVVGISLDEHRVLWRHPYKVTYGVSIATPLVRDGLVVVCGYWEGSKAIQLGESPEDAELKWEENRYLRGLMAQPLHRGDHAYLLDKSQGVVCFKLSSGDKVWNDTHQLTPRGRNPQATMIWLGDSDQILAMNSSGQLIHARLTPNGYEELNRCGLIGETWAHPAYSGRHVFARDDNHLVCVALPIQSDPVK